jgi:hypothetical protein
METFIFLTGLGIESLVLGFFCYLIYRDAKHHGHRPKQIHSSKQPFHA